MSDLLEEVLDGKGSENAVERILEFKRDFANRPGWEKGTPKRVNNLTKFTNLEWGKEDGKEVYKGKANMPGHVRAAINWNRLKKMHSDNYSMNIVDGMKTIVCKLKDNPMGYTSVGYPVDELNLPKWFRELPFDHKQMEATIVDQKIENLLGELNWDLTQKTQIHSTFEDLFIFE